MSRLSEEDAALEAALWAEMADPEPPPVPAVPPPAKVRRVTKRSRPLPETGGDGGLGALVNAASVRPNAAATAAMPAADDGDEGNDAAGYIWGMNIVTGKSREEEEAEAAAAAAHASSARGGETDGAGEPSKRSQALVQLRYGTYQGLELSANEVRRIKAEECRAMLSRRKLSLVLDLDHTLLNSATYSELTEEAKEQLVAWAKLTGYDMHEASGVSQPVPPLAEAANGASEAADSASLDAAAGCSSAEKASAASGGTGRPLLHHLGFIGMWTKLRPHVHEFLTAVSGMYELYVYTMGSRAYAAEMVRLLDPDGSLGLHGRDRVIGKEDATDAHTKALDVILDSDAMTLITDDSPGVWPQQANQLLVPRRYHFFPSSAARDTSLPAGYRCVLARAQDEQAVGGQLDALMGALTRIHAHYFDTLVPATASGTGAASEAEAAAGLSLRPPHVGDSVRAVRQQILGDATIVFSHVIPLEQQRRPEAHAAWRLAMDLGATVLSAVGPSVTHVIAGSDGTDKVRWARSHGVDAVTVEWLASCGYMWRRVDASGLRIDGVHAKDGPSLKLQQQLSTLPPPDLSSKAVA